MIRINKFVPFEGLKLRSPSELLRFPSFLIGDYESMRKDAFEFAKEEYFNGYADTCLVQENFNLFTSFIHDSADKQIPFKTSRSVSSVPWLTPEIRRKICRRNISC